MMEDVARDLGIFFKWLIRGFIALAVLVLILVGVIVWMLVR